MADGIDISRSGQGSPSVELLLQRAFVAAATHDVMHMVRYAVAYGHYMRRENSPNVRYSESFLTESAIAGRDAGRAMHFAEQLVRLRSADPVFVKDLLEQAIQIGRAGGSRQWGKALCDG